MLEDFDDDSSIEGEAVEDYERGTVVKYDAEIIHLHKQTKVNFDLI